MRPPATPPGITPAPDDAHPYRLPAALDPATLRRYFTLHAADREEVEPPRIAEEILALRGTVTDLAVAVLERRD